MTSKTWFLYTLKLKEDKWYVGVTQRPIERLQEHKSGFGSKWTAKYTVVGGYEWGCVPLDYMTPSMARLLETHRTKELMLEYGIANVRGGAYCQLELSQDTTEAIRLELRHAGNDCFKCGAKDHWAKNCSQQCASGDSDLDAPKSMGGDSNNSSQPQPPSFLFTDDASKNLFKDDASKNLFMDDANKNLFKDDASKNLFTDDANKNLFMDDANKNSLQMQGAIWAFYEEYQLKRQLSAHMSIKDIAQDHFRTEGAIRARIKKLSDDSDLDAPLDEVITLTKSMEGVKLNDSSKSPQQPPLSMYTADVNESSLQMQGAIWTFYEEYRLKRQLSAHMSIKDIAQDHFRTEGAIRARMKKLSAKN